MRAGDRVRLRQGPFAGKEGVILERSGNAWRVQVKVFGVATVVNVEADAFEVPEGSSMADELKRTIAVSLANEVRYRMNRWWEARSLRARLDAERDLADAEAHEAALREQTALEQTKRDAEVARQAARSNAELDAWWGERREALAPDWNDVSRPLSEASTKDGREEEARALAPDVFESKRREAFRREGAGQRRRRWASQGGVPLHVVGDAVSGNVEIDSPEDLDRLRGCARVDGNLDVRAVGLSDLSAVASLVEVTGSLRIESSDTLVDLSGLDRLTRVGGDLVVRDNAGLASLHGLGSLASVGGRVDVDGNPKLAFDEPRVLTRRLRSR